MKATAEILVSKRSERTVGPSLETRTLLEWNCSYYVETVEGMP